MKYSLILNPGSRGGKSRNSFEQIFKAFHKANQTYEHKITDTLEDAYTFSVEANKAGYDVIVAVGGDGTINNVLNGFFDDDGKRISKSKMAVIYTGTSPDFCKSYNIPIETEKAIQTIFDNRSRQIYLGRLICSSKNEMNPEDFSLSEIGSKKTMYFACCANIGLGATLARKANSGIRKYLGDTLGTFISLLRTLASYKPNDFHAVINSEKITLSKL